MRHEDFRRLNEERAARGETFLPTPATRPPARYGNWTPRVTACRPLDIYCYAVGYMEGEAPATHAALLALLRELGFRVNPESRLCPDIETAIEWCRALEQKRMALPYSVDGAVLKVNDRRTV